MAYLNFNLTTTPQRFHMLFPYSNPNAVNFTAWDNHLKMLLTESDYNDTRKLKLTDPDPEPETVEFHAWRRQQQSAPATPPCNDQR